MTNKKRLGQRLIEKGLITGEELSAALLEQSLTGEKLGRVLVKLKMISESTLNELLGIKEMTGRSHRSAVIENNSGRINPQV